MTPEQEAALDQLCEAVGATEWQKDLVRRLMDDPREVQISVPRKWGPVDPLEYLARCEAVGVAWPDEIELLRASRP